MRYELLHPEGEWVCVPSQGCIHANSERADWLARWNGEPMLQARIRIDGREYLVRPEHDAETIMGRITAKVKAGGGFVEILRTPDRAMSVLVSPGMSLSIEVTRVEDQPAASDEVLEQMPLALSSLDMLDVL